MAGHILFIDDDLPLRETLSLYLRRNGIKVTSAGTCEEAQQLAEKGGFSGVILDIKLGCESGMELLSIFRKKYPDLPVVMFTSLGDDPALKSEAKARGARGFYPKTESLDALLSGVKEMLA